MPGIVGDTGEHNLLEMINAMKHTDNLKAKLFDAGGISIGLIHRKKYECILEASIWQDNSKMGVIYGYAYSDEIFSQKNQDKIISSVLQNPEFSLPKLNGSFLIICFDKIERKLILATDKLATQPCFYCILKDRLIFSSEIKSILSKLDEISINTKAIGDLIAFEFMLGERTLINEIKSIPPATFIEWIDGKTKIKKYWNFNFRLIKKDKTYLQRLLKAYKGSVDQTLKNIRTYKVGIFLSGGLDSRLLAGVMVKNYGKDFLTITFDGNPFGGINLSLGKKVAECLGVENVQVKLDPRILEPSKIEMAVLVTDGLKPWIHILNLLSPDMIQNLECIDVLVNSSGQGEFFGENFRREELTSNKDSVDILSQNLVFRNPIPEKTVENILKNYSVRREIHKEVLKINKKYKHEKLLSVMYQNFYPNFHYKGNPLTSFVFTVNVFPNIDLLNAISSLPINLRWIRIANRFYIYPTSPLKLELIRQINMGLDKIPNERTRANPSSSIFFHFFEHYLNVVLSRIEKKNTNTLSWGGFMKGSKLQRYMWNTVSDFGERDFVNGNFLLTLLDQHMSGKANHEILLGAVTTAEVFIKNVLDG